MPHRTATEVLETIKHVLAAAPDGPVDIDADTRHDLTTAIEEAYEDLSERPQPELLATATEAFGGVLDVANRLYNPALKVEQLEAARDRLIKFVEIGLADLHARPQQDRPPAELETWQRKDAIELAIRWFEIEAGPGVLSKIAKIMQIMRGERVTGADPETLTDAEHAEIDDRFGSSGVAGASLLARLRNRG